MRKSKDSDETRTTSAKVYTKYTMYMHHLALLATSKGLFSHRSHMVGEKPKKVAYTVSHLCNNPGCYNPEHLISEPHPVNLSRIGCCKDLCEHDPKCLQTADQMKIRIRKLQSMYNSDTLYQPKEEEEDEEEEEVEEDSD
jgi:hypothetical protein